MPLGEAAERPLAAPVCLLYRPEELVLQAVGGRFVEQLERLSETGDGDRQPVETGGEVVENLSPGFESG